MQQIEIIKQVLPEFKINDYKILNTGANSVALIINNEYIFRFPLNKNNFESYLKEEKVLNIIRPYIKSVEIPQLNLYQYKDMYFTQHKMIKGVDYIKIKKPSKQLKQNLSKSLANFLFELHSIKDSKLDFIDVKQFNANAYNLNDKDNQKILINTLQHNCIDDINKSLDFVNNYKNFKTEYNVLCHDDLHEENILVQDDNLSGVIDFGCVVKRKYDTDFSNLLEYDIELGLMTIKEYEKLSNRKVDLKFALNIQKIRCYGLLVDFIKENNEKYIKLFITFLRNLELITNKITL